MDSTRRSIACHGDSRLEHSDGPMRFPTAPKDVDAPYAFNLACRG